MPNEFSGKKDRLLAHTDGLHLKLISVRSSEDINEKGVGSRRQAKQFCLAKQFCFSDADCLVVGERQGSFRRSAGKYPVKQPRPEDDSQTIGTNDTDTILPTR